MIAGLDSSFDRPTPAQAEAAHAAGVRVWAGYIGTRDGLGLAIRWTQANFDVVKQAGMTAIGYASGFDDPVAIRDMAAAWGILPGVDVEPGIRDDGAWVRDWVTTAGAGLYGLASVHYRTGEPIGRGAAWNVMANYPGFNPGATWIGGLTPPAAPHGWQWQGSHSEFGLDVDSNWFDDSFTSVAGGDPVVQSEKLAFVRLAYNTFLWRVPSADEETSQAAGIADDGSNLDAVLAAIEDSPEGDSIKALRTNLLKYANANSFPGQPGPAGPAGPNTDSALRAYLKGGPV
jgi:hypothetical protein